MLELLCNSLMSSRNDYLPILDNSVPSLSYLLALFMCIEFVVYLHYSLFAHSLKVPFAPYTTSLELPSLYPTYIENLRTTNKRKHDVCLCLSRDFYCGGERL